MSRAIVEMMRGRVGGGTPLSFGRQEFDPIRPWQIVQKGWTDKVLASYPFTGTEAQAREEARSTHPDGRNGRYEVTER